MMIKNLSMDAVGLGGAMARVVENYGNFDRPADADMREAVLAAELAAGKGLPRRTHTLELYPDEYIPEVLTFRKYHKNFIATLSHTRDIGGKIFATYEIN